MESLPATPPADKGLWLTTREIEALTAAKEAARDVRGSVPGVEGEEAAQWVAVAQADALRYSSWRARFLALAEAVLCSELVDARALALAIVEAAPATRSPALIPCADELQFYEGAAIRLLGRARLSGRRPTITLSADEAEAHADCIWALVAALRELA